MAYASVAQLRQYLPQIENTPTQDALLATILDRASAVVDLELGAAVTPPQPGAATVYGTGSIYLAIPQPYVAGSVTAVASPVTGVTVPAYAEHDGVLVALRDDGVVQPVAHDAPFAWYGSNVSVSTYRNRWHQGVPYVITAEFGRDADDSVITEITLRLASQLWRERDAGGSVVVGIEGAGAVELRQAYHPLVRRWLQELTALAGSAGVY